MAKGKHWFQRFLEPRNPVTGTLKSGRNRVTLSEDGSKLYIRGRKRPIKVKGIRIYSSGGEEVSAKDFAEQH